MNRTYLFKVNSARVILLLLLWAVWILYRHNLTDYVLLILLLIIFCGMFTVADVEVDYREVKIRKSYVWGVINIRRNLKISQLRSIRTRTCDAPMTGSNIETDNFLLDFFAFFYTPRLYWITTKLSYVDNNCVEKNIVLKIPNDIYKDIARRIKDW